MDYLSTIINCVLNRPVCIHVYVINLPVLVGETLPVCRPFPWVGGVFNKKTSVNVKMVTTINVNETTSMTWSGPRRPLFLHALSFECTSKMCINFINQFSV